MDFWSYYLGVCTVTVIFLLYYAYKLEKAIEKLKKEKDELNVQRAKDIASMFDQYITEIRHQKMLEDIEKMVNLRENFSGKKK